ncbi:MAG: YdbL family protein [Pseudomonadales bacterium]
MKQLIFVLLLTLIGINSAFALSLKEAKAQGLVGERNDGYVDYVVSPANAETKTLVKEVNNKRKAKFEATAKNNNLKVEQVATRFYQRAASQTAAGNYYQNAAGQWNKK